MSTPLSRVMGQRCPSPRVGGKFTAWDGYIEGITLEMEPDKRIV
jgi:hypothetical protein